MPNEERERKIVPHIPFYAQPGCKTIRQWEETFTDRLGNQATLTKLEYTDPKGKRHETILLVRWA